MARSGQSFREFEKAGWEDSGVVAKYDEHLSRVTTQSVGASPVLAEKSILQKRLEPQHVQRVRSMGCELSSGPSSRR